MASAKAIVARVGKASRQQHNSSIPDQLDSAAMPTPFAWSARRPRRATPWPGWSSATRRRYLGIAAAGLINVLDPELVILTGMVTYESGGLLLDRIREVVGEHVLQDGSRSVRIEQGTLGNNAAIIGAAATVCEQAFRVPVESEM